MSDLDAPVAARAVLVSLGVAGLGLGLGTLLIVVVAAAGAVVGLSPSPLVFLVLSLLLVQGVTFGGVAVWYLRYRGRPVRSVGVRPPTLRDLLAVVVGYVLALGGAIAGAVVVSSTGVEAGQNQVADVALANPEVLLVLIPGSFLLIGPGEELLFRGVVQGRLRETFGPATGVALASIIFAAVHFVALTGSVGARLVTITILLFPSLVFGSVYELTDNIVVPALVHGAYNATLFGLLYVALRYAQDGLAGAA